MIFVTSLFRRRARAHVDEDEHDAIFGRDEPDVGLTVVDVERLDHLTAASML